MACRAKSCVDLTSAGRGLLNENGFMDLYLDIKLKSRGFGGLPSFRLRAQWLSDLGKALGSIDMAVCEGLRHCCFTDSAPSKIQRLWCWYPHRLVSCSKRDRRGMGKRL